MRQFPESNYYGIFLSQDNDNNLIYASYTALPSNFLTLTKISPEGTEIWSSNLSSIAHISGVVCDSEKNIFIGGYVAGNDLEIDGVNYYSDTIYYGNGFIAKFNTNGLLENVEIVPGAFLDNIVIDSNDNLFISGDYYSPGMRVREFIIPEIIPCGYNCHRFFVSKLNSNNTCSWFKETNSSSYQSSLAVSQNGDLYVSGISLSFDSISGTGSVSIFKLDSNGIVQWLRENGGTAGAYPYDIAYNNPAQSLYIIGYYSSAGGIYNHNFWLGNDTLPHMSYIGDIFLAKMLDTTNTIFTAIAQPQIQNPESQITIFPNPTSSTFTIITNDNALKQITIYNTLGEKIMDLPLSPGEGAMGVRLSQPKGLYFVEIISDGKREMRKTVLN